MKKRLTTIGMATVLFATSLVNTGCFGEFALVRKVYTWNQGIMGDDLMGRFVKTLLFYAMNFIPVYGIAGLVDFWILNLVEFWTGSNPLAMGPNDSEEQLVHYKGKDYKITATQYKFSFVELKDGEEIPAGDLVFNTENISWNFEKDGLITELYKIKPQPNGNDLIEYKDVDGNFAWVTFDRAEAQYQNSLALK